MERFNSKITAELQSGHCGVDIPTAIRRCSVISLTAFENISFKVHIYSFLRHCFIYMAFIFPFFTVLPFQLW